jgi:putative hemin transport protein
MNPMTEPTPRIDRAAHLRAAWLELKTQRRIRQRDAAELLEVSEAELLATGVGDGVTRLAGDPRGVLKRAPTLGRVMALTRNESCVHEKIGVYENLEVDKMVGLALGADIDLRLFFAHWKHAFAVTEAGDHGAMKSLQFYDAAGRAVHKIFLKDGADGAAYERVVREFAASDQDPGLEVAPPAPRKREQPDAAVDAAGLRAAWAGLQDTHEFFGLLGKFDVSRTQALRLGGTDLAYPAPLDAVRRLLEDVASSGLPIMVFVGNPGCIQIHTGPVRNLRPIDHWLNVLDPGFNLHLRTDRIAAAWVVRKPTLDGIVTSLELFDAAGETIAMLFGERKPGRPELPQWQATVERLFPAPACTA